MLRKDMIWSLVSPPPRKKLKYIKGVKNKWELQTMREIILAQIEDQLEQLPPERLAVVLDFVSYLAARQSSMELTETAVASEVVLGKDWNRPEEDEAWANL